jgi:hypothetical protein
VNGFIIGPLVAALFMAFWGIFIREIHILAPDAIDDINPDHTQTAPVEPIASTEKSTPDNPG